MQTVTCPSLEQLREFSSGYLDDDSAAAIGNHLNDCAACHNAIEQLSQSGDALLTALRERETAGPFSDETEFRRALEFVAAIGHSAASAAPLGQTGRAQAAQPHRLREYELLEKLGEGGMGAVCKARHAKLKKLVALKVLPRERLADAGAVARFEREMEAVGQLDHPHIVRAMDAGEVAGTHFLVMEYVAGIDLSQLVRRLGPLPIAEACEIVRQAAIGLQEAHERGMVQRDIKPSNIMLAVGQASSLPGKQPVVKILDLGLALLSENVAPGSGDLTSTGQLMGTLDYMAPEQGGDSHKVDIRADIYSLGATLYKLLTGEAIYHGAKLQTPVQKLMALATQSAPSLDSRRPDAPLALIALVARLLARDPALRPATPAEVAEALAPFAAGADLAALAARSQASLSNLCDDQNEASRSTSNLTAEVTTEHRVVTRLLEPPVPPAAANAANPAPANRRQAPAWPLIAAASGGLALLLLGILLYLQTPEGTIRIETNDDAIKVLVDNRGATITGAGEPHEISVKAGKHGLRITRGDFTFDTKSFELTRGETTTLKIEFLPGSVQIVKDGKPFDSKKEELALATPSKVADTRPLASEATGPSAPPVSASNQDKPFVLIRAGQPAGKFTSFSGAIADLRPGDAIEIHGNGPFSIGKTKLEGQGGLTLRAAPGFRPRLEMSASVLPVHPQAENVWLTVLGGELTIEDCDLVGTNHAHWFRHAGGQMTLCRCRLLRCASLGVYEAGPGMRIEDCLLDTANGLAVEAKDARVEMHNGACVNLGVLFSVYGGTEIRLSRNSIFMAKLASVVPVEPARPTRFHLSDNAFAATTVLSGWPAMFWARSENWRALVEWQGRGNVYAGPFAVPAFSTPDKASQAIPADEWEKLLAAEEDSRKIERLEFGWQAASSLSSPFGFAALRESLATVRRTTSLTDVGPDLDELGPGDAYLRSGQRETGRAIPQEMLRPEAEEAGPFVVLRGNKAVRGYSSLHEAVVAAGDGDTIEIRTDVSRPGAAIPADKGQLTIRAAWGYRPVLTSDIVIYSNSTLKLAGLHVQGNVGGNSDACIARVANCTIDGSIRLQTTADNPAEIVNSTASHIRCIQSNGKIAMRHSVIGQLDLLPVEGESRLEFDHCAIWQPGEKIAMFSSKGPDNSIFSVQAANTLFEAGVTLAKLQPMKWAGSQNVYRVGAFHWMYGASMPGLAGWRKHFNSAEDGSLQLDPLIDDPRMWKIVTPELAAQPVGADVSRLGSPAKADAASGTTPSGQ